MIRNLHSPAELPSRPLVDAARSALRRWWRACSPRLEPWLAWRRAAWRRRWLGLGSAALICLAGWTGTLLLPNPYRSSALLFADPGRGVTLEGGADAWTAAALAALRSALLAPAVLAEVDGAPALAASGATATTSEQLDGRALPITIATEGPALFRVSYQAQHPDAAERGLQALVDLVTGGQEGSAQAAGAPDQARGSSGPGIAAELQASRDQAGALRSDLAAALALRDAHARQLAEVPPVPTGRRNPVYDQTAIQLGQQETLVAGLRSQLVAAEAMIAALGQQLEAGAGDHATAATPASRAASAAADSSGPVFRIVGPPSRPAGPESMLRLLLLVGIATAGMLVGCAVAIWRGQRDGVVDSASQLERRFQLPVLGTIFAPGTPGGRLRQRQARIDFGLACLGLLVLSGSLATAEALDLLAPLLAPTLAPPAG